MIGVVVKATIRAEILRGRGGGGGGLNIRIWLGFTVVLDVREG